MSQSPPADYIPFSPAFRSVSENLNAVLLIRASFHRLRVPTAEKLIFANNSNQGVTSVMPPRIGWVLSFSPAIYSPDTTDSLEFMLFTKKAAAANGHKILERCLQLADRFIAEGDQDLQNALAVSFLEHLPRQGEVHRKLRRAMSLAMRQGWDDIVAYMDSIPEKDNG